jgi:hypothetical protein
MSEPSHSEIAKVPAGLCCLSGSLCLARWRFPPGEGDLRSDARAEFFGGDSRAGLATALPGSGAGLARAAIISVIDTPSAAFEARSGS